MSFHLDKKSDEDFIALKFSLTKWIILVSPMIPHIAEELWKKIGYQDTLVCEQDWPKPNMSYTKRSEINIVVQVNGKKRLVCTIPKDLDEEETKRLMMKNENVKSIIKNSEIKKIIVVPNKIFSLVI